MDFIKKNLILIVSGAVAVLSLVGLVLGIGQIGGITDLLSPAQQQAETVKTLLIGVSVTGPGGETKNLIPTQGVIENLKKASVLFKVQGHKALQEVLQENIGYDPVKKTLKRQPILDGIFPKPVPETIAYKFPPKYKEAINSLLVKMQAGVIPDAKEIAQEKELLLQEQGLMGEDVTKTKRITSRMEKEKPGTSLEMPQENMDVRAVFRAAMKRAEKIKVYCEPFTALDIISEVYSPTTGRPPGVEEMWWAQLSYWIQDDIAGAVAQANSSAKNVLDSVVKQINKIQVMHGFLVSSGEGKVDFVGAEEFHGPESFSGLSSDQYCDVLRFSIVLVVDARKIPLFIDAMYRQSHYLLYMWNIEAINSVSDANAGPGVKTSDLYQFGSVPVVKLTTYWEGYLLRDFYHWGIVGYGANDKGKSFVTLYDGTTKELEDMDKRTGLMGLMPKTIRQALGSEPEGNPAEPPK